MRDGTEDKGQKSSPPTKQSSTLKPLRITDRNRYFFHLLLPGRFYTLSDIWLNNEYTYTAANFILFATWLITRSADTDRSRFSIPENNT